MSVIDYAHLRGGQSETFSSKMGAPTVSNDAYSVTIITLYVSSFYAPQRNSCRAAAIHARSAIHATKLQFMREAVYIEREHGERISSERQALHARREHKKPLDISPAMLYNIPRSEDSAP